MSAGDIGFRANKLCGKLHAHLGESPLATRLED